MDDFSGDSSTTGVYNVGSAPLVIRSDFDRDTDWVKVNSFREHYSYEILTYPGNTAIGHEYRVYALDGSSLVAGGNWSVPRTIHYKHLESNNH